MDSSDCIVAIRLSLRKQAKNLDTVFKYADEGLSSDDDILN